MTPSAGLWKTTFLKPYSSGKPKKQGGSGAKPRSRKMKRRNAMKKTKARQRHAREAHAQRALFAQRRAQESETLAGAFVASLLALA
tara:strand:- start:185 stop:442 length:258 start_codon:yes stop_codon:yes gene_type:complete